MLNLDKYNKLTSKFYSQKTTTVAKALLGKILVHSFPNKIIAGRIVETEAYLNKNDEASHSYSGKTLRNKTMFNSPGYLYVYQIYGIHFCCNVVTEKEDVGAAVLIRALEPLVNIEEMEINRGTKNVTNLTNGPAKLCQALSITKLDDGCNLLNNNIYILDAPSVPKSKIVKTTRIGITKSAELPLRFYIKDNPFVSKK